MVLSRRELECVALLAKGLTNEAIALSMSLTQKTVKNYLVNVYDKLELHSRVAVARWYWINYEANSADGPKRGAGDGS